jgi:hypothetical protein
MLKNLWPREIQKIALAIVLNFHRYNFEENELYYLNTQISLTERDEKEIN